MRYTIVAIVLALCALCTVPANAESRSRPPSSPQPALSGSLSLGAANQGFRLGGDEAQTAFAIEGKMKAENLLGPLALNLGARYIADDHPAWLGKSRVQVGLELPVSESALLFTEWERQWRTDNEWLWMGVRLKFGN